MNIINNEQITKIIADNVDIVNILVAKIGMILKGPNALYVKGIKITGSLK